MGWPSLRSGILCRLVLPPKLMVSEASLVMMNLLGEYCGPHTASSVFLILVFQNLNYV